MKFQISSQYGVLEQVRDGAHTGIDLAMPQGTPLRSFIDGVVSKVDFIGNRNIGKEIVIQDDNGVSHIYGHLSEVDVHPGQHIHSGDLIGLSGNTGHTVGSGHLHYGEWTNGHFINPSNHIEQVANFAGDSHPLWQGAGSIFLQDKMQSGIEQTIWHILGALRDVTLELIDSVALLGSAILILLSVGGMKRSKRYIWILLISRIIIKFLLGGYLT